MILDRDYRPDSVIHDVEQDFRKEDITAHVWRRKELESYLLTPEVIARLAGGPLPTVAGIIDSATVATEMSDYVFGQMLGERVKIEVSAKRDSTDVMRNLKLNLTSYGRFQSTAIPFAGQAPAVRS